MAAGPTHPATGNSGVQTRPVESERLILDRLERTRREVRWLDLAAELTLLATGVLAYLFLAAVVDQWVIPGGLGTLGRWVMWLVLVAGVVCDVLFRIAPLMLHRINPVFAAYTIEQARPSLKNALINLLLLRRQKDEIARNDLARRVYAGLEERTAKDLSQAPGTAVDRSRLIRLLAALAAVLAVAMLYLVLSPKSSMTSFGRVLWPWSRAGAPTRVEIVNVQPGDTTAYQGDTLIVSAEVRGLRADDSVTLRYSTADGQSVDEAVPMTVLEGGYRYQCELPPAKAGLQQSLTYTISAGDATTRPFHVEVQTPLAITVDKVEYEYPKYTGLAPRVVERDGDLRAIEGTHVTIRASANQPIQQATMEMNCDPRQARRMTASGQSAHVGLMLRMSPDDPTQPEYTSYRLRFTDPQQRENRRPIRHRIEVVPDLKPEVRLVDPPAEEVQLPLNGKLALRVHAEDPDFGLRRVGIRAEREGRTIVVPPMLDKPGPQKAHQGPFEGTSVLEPAKLGLKVGDRVQYWAEALDSKEDSSGPAPNRAETTKRTIIVVDETAQKNQPKENQGQGQQKKDDQQQGQGDNNQQQQNNHAQQGNDPGQQGQQGENQKPSKGQQGKQPENGKEQSGDNQHDQQPNQEGNQGESKDGQGGKSKPQGGGQKNGEASKDQSQGGESGDKGEQSGDDRASGKPGSKSGQSSDQQNEKIDGQTQAADAMDKILEHQAKQNGQQGEQKQQGDQQQGDQKPGAEKQQGEKPKDGHQQGEGQPKEQSGQPNDAGPQDQQQGKQSGQQKQGKKQSGAGQPQAADQQNPGDEQQAGQENQKSAGKGKRGDKSKPSGEMKPGDQQEAGEEKPAGQGQRGQAGKQAGKRQTGENQGIGEEKPAGQGEQGGAGEPSGQKPGDEKQPGSEQGAQDKQPASGQNAGQPKQGERKPGGQPKEGAEPGASGEKSQGQEKPAGMEKSGTKESSAAGAKGDERQEDSNRKPGAKSEPGDESGKPVGEPKKSGEKQAGQGTQKRPEGEGAEENGQPKTSEKAEAKAGEPGDKQGEAGAGKKAADNQGTTAPQENNKPGKMTPGKEDTAKSTPQEAQSPSTSPKQSDSKGDEGDRSGGGGKGGGQNAKQQGTGSAGSKTSSDQGDSQSEEPGEGETGNKPGDQVKSKEGTGKPGPKEKGEGTGQKQPGGKETNPQAKGKDEEKGAKSEENGKQDPSASGKKPGNDPSKGGASAAGNPDAGGVPGEAKQPDAPPDQGRLGGEDANLAYANKQTTLALNHLRDETAKQKSDLLDQLGWSKQDAEKFLSQWEEMKKTAKLPGTAGQKGKQELDDALKALDLRPRSTSLRSSSGQGDKVQGLKDPGRFPAPAKWRDLYRAYKEGKASHKD